MKKVFMILIIFSSMNIAEEGKNTPEVNDMKKLQNIIIDTVQSKSKLGLLKIENKDEIGIFDIKLLKDYCNKIMDDIGNNNLKEAFIKIKLYTWLPEKETDLVYDGTIKQLEIAKSRYGTFIGYELVREENISTSLVKLTYIAKCTNHPLVWRFLFYKAKNKWTLNYFYWDDKIQNL